MRLTFDDQRAALYDDAGNCVRAFGWSGPGSHVWETVGEHPRIRNVSVRYRKSSNTILAETDPLATAKHLAEVCGISAADIARR